MEIYTISIKDKENGVSIPDLGKSKLDSPHLSLVLQAISADDLEPKEGC
jgi:hypothetical protein